MEVSVFQQWLDTYHELGTPHRVRREGDQLVLRSGMTRAIVCTIPWVHESEIVRDPCCTG